MNGTDVDITEVSLPNLKENLTGLQVSVVKSKIVTNKVISLNGWVHAVLSINNSVEIKYCLKLSVHIETMVFGHYFYGVLTISDITSVAYLLNDETTWAVTWEHPAPSGIELQQSIALIRSFKFRHLFIRQFSDFEKRCESDSRKRFRWNKKKRNKSYAKT